MRGFSISVLSLCGFILLAAPAHAADAVGKVKEMTGSATVTRDKKDAPLKTGDAVEQQDVIESGDGARVDIVFADGTNLVMAGRGRLSVDKFYYDPKKSDDGEAEIGIFGAAFSYVGGMLDKAAKPHVTLNSDFGSIGIRGTSLYGAMAEGRSMIFLENGAADVTNKGGKVSLEPGFGTSIGSESEAPRPPYQWSADEIAWIKHEIAEPSLHNALMAANSIAEPMGGKALDRMEAAKTASAPGAAGGATGQIAASAPAAPAAASAEAAAAPAAAIPAAPAEAKTKAESLLPVPILSLKSLSPDKLGTKFLKDPTDKDALRVDTQWPVTLNLAVIDVSKMNLEDTVLKYTAQMKSEHLLGPAYLEMWLHFPDQTRDVFVNGRAAPMTGDTDWKEMQTSYTLKKGQIPERITLNLAVNGKGVVLVKDVKLVK